MAASEPFPLLNTSADLSLLAPDEPPARRRRKSSGLGRDITAGDTGPSLEPLIDSLLTGSPSGSSSSSGPPNGVNGRALHATEHKTHSKRKKTRSLLRRSQNFAIKHTWAVPLALVVVILSAYAINPTESNPIHRFIFLSYKLPLQPGADPSTPHQYGKGRWDIALVSFYTIVLTFTREFIMQELLRPLARYYGIRSRGKQLRFMEQMYTAIYFGCTGPAGIYVMRQTPVWYFSAQGMFEAFPHKTHEAIFKFYYLFQAAYWAEQALVMLLGMEKRRKDFKELVAHHIVTLALIGLSYRFHFTYIGIAVYLTHDISDFFLAISKTLNYIDSPAIGPFFGTSIAMWIYLRHYLNLHIIYSLFNEFKTVGPYGIVWETEQYKGPLSFWITLGLLAVLQSLNLFWLFCLLRIAYKFVVLNIAKDDRSEDEESSLDEVEAEEQEAHALLEAKEAVNGHANGHANGHNTPSVKVTGVDTASTVTKRGGAK